MEPINTVEGIRQRDEARDKVMPEIKSGTLAELENTIYELKSMSHVLRSTMEGLEEMMACNEIPHSPEDKQARETGRNRIEECDFNVRDAMDDLIRVKKAIIELQHRLGKGEKK